MIDWLLIQGHFSQQARHPMVCCSRFCRLSCSVVPGTVCMWGCPGFSYPAEPVNSYPPVVTWSGFQDGCSCLPPPLPFWGPPLPRRGYGTGKGKAALLSPRKEVYSQFIHVKDSSSPSSPTRTGCCSRPADNCTCFAVTSKTTRWLCNKVGEKAYGRHWAVAGGWACLLNGQAVRGLMVTQAAPCLSIYDAQCLV